MDDFELSCRGLYRALTIREKYMRLAYQRFPRTASQYLRDIEGETFKTEDQVQPGEEEKIGAPLCAFSTMYLLLSIENSEQNI